MMKCYFAEEKEISDYLFELCKK